MTDLAHPGTHTDALVAKLDAAGFVVGDAGPPAHRTPPQRHGWQGTPTSSRFIDYVIVHQLDHAMDGSLGTPDDSTDFRWQVTCVAATRSTCDALVAAVNDALIGQTLTVAGRTVPRIRPDGGAATHREDDAGGQSYRFVAMPRFAAWSH